MLGVLSLILWSLVGVISVKYLVVVLRADNGGEGGIMALMAIARSVLHPTAGFSGCSRSWAFSVEPCSLGTA